MILRCFGEIVFFILERGVAYFFRRGGYCFFWKVGLFYDIALLV